ncbi:MAG: hypothetical protein AAF969_01570 [Bacteroidota bacterium]
MERQIKEKVFVKVNQKWQKAEVVSEKDGMVSVKTNEGQSFDLTRNSRWLEALKSPAQRYAYGDVKEQLEGQYISFEKLPENVQDNLVQGREYLHESTYVSEGQLKDSSKMIQMIYDQDQGSRLDLQYRRNEPITLEKAMAYNHKFSAEEFERMVEKKEFIVFQGTTTDGELFEKLAYYEPKLQDIRTKSALGPNTYLYGEKLTLDQANALNQGKAIEMDIKSNAHGSKPYLVSYSPRKETFITRNVDMSKAMKMDVVTDEKKKASNRRVKV